MKRFEFLISSVVLFLLLGLVAGCAIFKKEEGKPPSDTSLKASFSDFEGVVIPSELSLNKKKSYVYSATRTKVGLLTFEGRVEPDSLATFFQTNLPRGGWKSLTALKDREHSLIFLKDDRVCLITISEAWFTTVCEVRVGLVEKTPEPSKGTPTR
jgi:hypothetical protein